MRKDQRVCWETDGITLTSACKKNKKKNSKWCSMNCLSKWNQMSTLYRIIKGIFFLSTSAIKNVLTTHNEKSGYNHFKATLRVKTW